ncbi:ATP-dependent DNA helicase [Magnetococcales bacterium HHB-1]
MKEGADTLNRHDDASKNGMSETITRDPSENRDALQAGKQEHSSEEGEPPPEKVDVKSLIRDLFSKESALAATIPNYEIRQTQVRMAFQVVHAVQEKKSLIVEAGTGTGKTLGYLLPLLACGYRVIVSTATRSLQDQIWEKDTPLLRHILDRPLKVTILKGRQNYLCQSRLKSAKQGLLQVSQDSQSSWESILDWSEQTDFGDRDELTEVPIDFPLWRDLNAGHNDCSGKQCDDFETCYLTRARDRAMKADLILVNHHLFCADLAMRGEGFGRILPDCDVAVFDEAHRLPDVATEFFGDELSNLALSELVNDTRLAMGEQDLAEENLFDALEVLEVAATRLRNVFPMDEQRDAMPSPLVGPLKEVLDFVEDTLSNFKHALEPHQGQGVTLAQCGRRAMRLLEICRRFLREEDPSYAYWYQIRPRSVVLHASPLNVGPLLRESMIDRVTSTIYTSATLSTSKGTDGFTYFFSQSGAPQGGTLVDQLPPAFDYQEQSLFYLPPSMPEPNNEAFPDAVVREIEQLITVSKGRAFCLFTSYRMLNYTRDALRDRIPYQILAQGENSRSALLEAFKEDKHSVLLGASSFWEGVDVPGEALSLVIIDRIPFESPDDPLFRARADYASAQNLHPFQHLTLPRAVIALKQGVGRLIRTSSDKGVIALLDSRIVHRRYGPRIQESLPPAPVTRNIQDVARFFGHSITFNEHNQVDWQSIRQQHQEQRYPTDSYANQNQHPGTQPQPSSQPQYNASQPGAPQPSVLYPPVGRPNDKSSW